MATGKALSETEIRAALAELNELCEAEYGIELEELLTDKTKVAELRMQRLVGIVLKQRFSSPGSVPTFSETNARRAWIWKDGSLEGAAGTQRELELLNQLRMPGPWNWRKTLSGTHEDNIPITWDEFKHDVEHERGLFKVVALYVADKVKGREGKTLDQYLDAKESREFEAGLDLAVLLSDAAVLTPIASLLGLPSLSVGFALVIMQFGYRRLTDPAEGNNPDRGN